MDISPKDFASLTLPVYKAMFEHMPKMDMWNAIRSGMQGMEAMPVNQALRMATMIKHYTSVSFGRLLALARRQLRLNEMHFEAARDAVINKSGLVLASNLQQEQVGHCLRTTSIRTKKTFLLAGACLTEFAIL